MQGGILVLVLTSLTSAFNLEPRGSIILSDKTRGQVPEGRESYFGFSVALHFLAKERATWWVGGKAKIFPFFFVSLMHSFIQLVTILEHVFYLCITSKYLGSLDNLFFEKCVVVFSTQHSIVLSKAATKPDSESRRRQLFKGGGGASFSLLSMLDLLSNVCKTLSWGVISPTSLTQEGRTLKKKERTRVEVVLMALPYAWDLLILS